ADARHRDPSCGRHLDGARPARDGALDREITGGRDGRQRRDLPVCPGLRRGGASRLRPEPLLPAAGTL
ncbi:MAG: hypothetical protein AVDCRST_MAG15-328, partial [uncultured Rubellimicrobium sp.]